MNHLLNYKQSTHFKQRLAQRQINPVLVSICLIKGAVNIMQRHKVEFTLSKERIMNAIEEGYVLVSDCLGITSLTVVVRQNILITVFVKLGDTGITN